MVSFQNIEFKGFINPEFSIMTMRERQLEVIIERLITRLRSQNERLEFVLEQLEETLLILNDKLL